MLFLGIMYILVKANPPADMPFCATGVATILLIAFSKEKKGAGKVVSREVFVRIRGGRNGNPQSFFNHHHGRLTVPARQPNQKAHLLLVSLNNEL